MGVYVGDGGGCGVGDSSGMQGYIQVGAFSEFFWSVFSMCVCVCVCVCARAHTYVLICKITKPSLSSHSSS